MSIIFILLMPILCSSAGFYSSVHDLERINCTNHQFSIDDLIEFSKSYKSFAICAVHILNNNIYIQNNNNETLKAFPTRQLVKFERVQPLYFNNKELRVVDGKWKFFYLTHGAVNIFHILLDDILPTYRYFGDKFFDSVDIDIVLLGKFRTYDDPLLSLYSVLSKNFELRFLDYYENMTLPNVIFANGHLEQYTRPLFKKEIFDKSKFDITLANTSLIRDDYLNFSKFIKQRYQLNHIDIPHVQFTTCPRHIPLLDDQKKNCIFTIIRRNNDKRRRILNENAFLSLLKTFGNIDIRVITLETMKFEDQIDSIRNTDILFGAHGAGLIHVLWMKKNSMLIEVFGPGYDKQSYREISQRMGIHHASWYLPNQSKTLLKFDRITDFRDKDIILEVNENIRDFIETCINIACYS